MKSTAKELFVACLNYGRPFGSKDIVLWKRKIKDQGLITNDAQNENEQIVIKIKWFIKRAKTLIMYDL